MERQMKRRKGLIKAAVIIAILAVVALLIIYNDEIEAMKEQYSPYSSNVCPAVGVSDSVTPVIEMENGGKSKITIGHE